VKGGRDILAEGIHFGFVVGARLVGVGRPFLVPFIERLAAHFQGVEELGGQEFLVNRDKVGFKGILEILPTTKVWRGVCKGSLLAVFHPFSGGGAQFKVGKRGSDLLTGRGVQILVKEVIICEVCPKGFSVG
jgi:hypothetical protein